jgi:DNA polymerase elongation subunit (family B)
MGPGMALPKPLVRFSIRSSTYKVDRHEGPHIYSYFTDELGHTGTLITSGFYPYLMVKLGTVGKPSPQDIEPRQLVDELQDSLLAIMAYDVKHRNSPARKAMVEGFVGTVERNCISTIWYKPRPDTKQKPIIGYEIVHASIGRGTGEGHGYRGIRASRMLKIYFFCPSILVLARSLMQGKWAELGPVKQLQKLATHKGGFSDKDNAQVAASLVSGPRMTDYMRDVNDEHEAVAAARDSGGISAEVAAQIEELDTEINTLVDEARYGDEEQLDKDETPMDVDVKEEPRDQSNDEPTPDNPVLFKTLAQLMGNFGYKSDDPRIVLCTDEYSERALMYEKVELEFQRRTLLQFNAKRATYGSDSVLNKIRQNSALVICDADFDFILRFFTDAKIAPEEWVQVDTLAAMLDNTIGTNRDDVRYNEVHSADNGHVGFPDNSWMLPDTPPGIPPVELLVRRVQDWQEIETHSQIEIRCDWHHLKRVDDEKLQATIPQPVTVSTDGEMQTGENFKFCRPETEDVLKICNVIPLPPRLKSKYKKRYVVFSLGDLEERHKPLKDIEEFTLCFDDKVLMMMAFAQWVRAVGAENWMSFNGDTFDFPYFAAYSKRLGVEDEFLNSWSMFKYRSPMRFHPRVFQSIAHGRHDFIEVAAEGVTFFDIYQMVKRNPNIKLKSNSLNGLSEAFLKDKKEDVDYKIINGLQQTRAGRRRLTDYCFKDSDLTMRLDDKKKWRLDLIEKARITGVFVPMLIQRGMGIQGKAVIYRASREGLFIPVEAVYVEGVLDAGKKRLCVNYTRSDYDRIIDGDSGYEGAIVIEPERGVYLICVGTLDFNSLYPSIQMAENLCTHTTVAKNYDINNDEFIAVLRRLGKFGTPNDRPLRRMTTINTAAPNEPEIEKPDDAVFLNHTVLRGLLPDIQRGLVTGRKRTRAQMKPIDAILDDKARCATMDPVELAELRAKRDVLDGRQTNQKLCSNSLYGIGGSPMSFQYSPQIAASVTLCGRGRIYWAKWIAEHVILQANRADPLVQAVAQFPGIKNELLNIPDGASVVDKLVRLVTQARHEATLRPEVVRRSKKSVRKTAGAAQPNVSKKRSQTMAAVMQEQKRRKLESQGVRQEATTLDEAPIEDDYEWDSDVNARVIYGDTDSIMVRFWRGLSIDLAGELCIVAADFISICMHIRYGTSHLQDCVYRIEFEKLFTSFLLVDKKRYAGIKWVLNGKTGKLEIKDEGKPSISGLESNRRDTMRLIGRCFPSLLSIMLDSEYEAEQNLRRARALIWHQFISPFVNGTVDMFDVVLTRQLRNFIEAYTEKGRAPPIHVWLARTLTIRAGGKEQPNAPKSGDRLSYVVLKGTPGKPVAQRGETPQYAYEHQNPLDTNYYLEIVSATVLRLLKTVITAGRTDWFGVTEDDRDKAKTNFARSFLFGSPTEYLEPEDANEYDLSKYNTADDFADIVVRYPQRRTIRSTLEATQHLGHHGGVSNVLLEQMSTGASCTNCGRFMRDRSQGAVCDTCCVGARAEVLPELEEQMSRLLLDDRCLTHERANIVAFCQNCMGCSDGYKEITCVDFGCDVAWKRIGNQQTMRECSNRITDIEESLRMAREI